MAVTDLVGRINRLFHGLMGCELEFQAAEKLNSEDWKNEDFAIMRAQNSAAGEMPRFFTSANSLTFGFPIAIDGAFVGLAIVRGWQGHDSKKLLMAAELLSIVLEHGIQTGDRTERLRLIEERLRLIDESSNVIAMRPTRNQTMNTSMQVTDLGEPREVLVSPVTTLPLLIETKMGFPLQRVAIEIHQMSGRWAFLSTDELPQDIFNSRESVQELGGITLLIKDLALLTTNQQIKLAEYLSIQPSMEMPQVIAGITSPLPELLATAKVLPHLAGLFCHSTLQWSGKSSEQISGELVAASLEHILDQTRQIHVVDEGKFIPFHAQYFDPDQPFMH